MRVHSHHLIAAALIIGLLDCKHAPPRVPSPEPPSAGKGRVGFEFIADPTVSLPKVTDHQELVAPDALGASAQPTSVTAP